ncbi:MAG: LLM class flavin-dependent oxidoreductase [Armatimonadetes bacterium]|nr:MAG: LLM class flavin-dependent oxidoreductase [Armatimonadota bacterium]
MVRRDDMELGLFVEPQCGGSYDRLLQLAQWAETAGLDAFARSDHYLNGEESAHATDALTSFGGLARETSTIRLVSLVSPISFRHPAVMAKSATTIDEMSGGRFTLGVGTGWMESEHDAFGMDLPPLAERFDRLEESLEVITTMFSGGGSVDGTYYSLKSDTVAPSASQGLQIVIGGSGPRKTPTLAGTYAHEYNSFVTDRQSFDARRRTLRSAATGAGRNPDDILISFSGPALVYESESEHAEALVTRGARRDMTADEYSAFLDERCVPHGPPERARQAIDQMASWGVGRYYVQEYTPLDDVDLNRMDRIFSALK